MQKLPSVFILMKITEKPSVLCMWYFMCRQMINMPMHYIWNAAWKSTITNMVMVH